jgi:hypothetical protein
MPKEYKFGFVIEGDADSGVKALRKVKEEVDGLDSANKKTKQSAEGLAKSSEDASGSFGTMSKAVGVAAAALGGIATVAYFKGLVTDAIDAADNLNDLSKTTGLTVERLSGLSLAAKESGTELGATAKAINFLSKGIGGNAEKYRELGITAKDPIEAFKQLADQFVATTDIQARNALAADALGKSWETVGPLLAEGGAAIQEMVDRGQDLSGITTKMATDADAYNDSVAVIQQSVGGLVNSIAAGLLPSLAGAAESVATFAQDGSLEEWIDGAKIAAEALAVVLISRAAPGMIALAAQGYTAVASLTAVEASLLTTAVATKGLNAALMLVGGPVGATVLAVGGLVALVSSMESSAERAVRLREEMDELTAAELRNAKASAESEREMALSSLARAERTRTRSAADERAYQTQATRVREVTDRIKEYDATLAKNGATAALTAEAYIEMMGIQEKTSSASTSLNEKTKDLIASLEGQKKTLTLNAREQAIYKAGLDAIAAEATPAAIEKIKELAAELYDTEIAFKASQKAAEENGAAYVKYLDGLATDRIKAEEEWAKGVAAVNETVGAIAQKTAEDAAKANDEAAKDSTEYWNDFEDDTKKIFSDIISNWTGSWEDAGEYLEKYMKSLGVNMLANFLGTGVTKLAQYIGIGPSGSVVSGSGAGGDDYGGLIKSGLGVAQKHLGGGTGSVVSGVEYMDASGNLVTQSTGSKLVGSAKSIGTNLVAGYAGAAVGNKAGEALFDKEAESGTGAAVGGAIGSTWGPLGTAVGAFLGGLVDVATGGDGKTRSNAGFVAAPTPGLKAEYNAGEREFASGLKVNVFSRRGDVQDANSITDIFQTADAEFTSLIKELGGTLKVTQLNGLDEEATPGSSGTFFGAGGNGITQGDIGAQLNSFIDQLADHVTGLDSALMSSVQSASSAEEALVLLSQAVAEKTAEDKKALETAEEKKHRELVGAAMLSLDEFGGIFSKISSTGFEAADSMISLAGGIDKLIEKSEKFVSQYYTNDEQLALQASDLVDALSGLGLSSDAIRDLDTKGEYRALVESMDVASQAGRESLNALLDIAPQFSALAEAMLATKDAGSRSLLDIAGQIPGADLEALRRLNPAINPDNIGSEASVKAISDMQKDVVSSTKDVAVSVADMGASFETEIGNLKRDTVTELKGIYKILSEISTNMRLQAAR